MVNFLLSFFLVSPLVSLRDQVDRTEINHVYDSDGGLVFDQVIWWDWDKDYDRYKVVDWRLLKGVRFESPAKRKEWEDNHPDGPPYVPDWFPNHACPTYKQGKYVSKWFDENQRVHRTVISFVFVETWTDYDREILERSVLDENRRRRLRSKN